MTGQQLKNSILQMAVQGKLVPQDPNDEPASVLLERIRKEKEQLIKEGKIKKEKNPSYIFRGADNLPYEKVGKNEPVCIADEVPFEIPESWEWVRLGNIFQHNTGKALNASNRTGSLLPYITTSNLYWDRFELGNLREMYFSENEIENVPQQKAIYLFAKVEISGVLQYGCLMKIFAYKIIFISFVPTQKYVQSSFITCSICINTLDGLVEKE